MSSHSEMSPIHGQEQEDEEYGQLELYNGQQQTFEAGGGFMDDMYGHTSGDENADNVAVEDETGDICTTTEEEDETDDICTTTEEDDSFYGTCDATKEDETDDKFYAKGAAAKEDETDDDDLKKKDMNDNETYESNDSSSLSLEVMSDAESKEIEWSDKKKDKKRKREMNDANDNVNKRRKVYMGELKKEKYDEESVNIVFGTTMPALEPDTQSQT
eukprot:479202_1